MAVRRRRTDAQTGSEDRPNESNASVQCYLASAFSAGRPLLETLAGPFNSNGPMGLLDSPYDWRSLLLTSRSFCHLGSWSCTPLRRSIDHFKLELGAWGAKEVNMHAAMAKPDVDRIFFALRMRGFGKRRKHGLMHKGPAASDCELACSALAAILPWEKDFFLRSCRSWTRKTYEDRIAELGGVDAVLLAMEDFPDVLPVQEQGCHILANLANEYCIQEGDLGRCLLAILSAMEVHTGSVKLQESGCRAVGSLEISNEQMLVPCGGIRTILRAMKDHPGAACLQREACGTLNSMITNHKGHADNTCVQIAALGGGHLILEAVRIHQDDKDLLFDACTVLAVMLKTTILSGHVHHAVKEANLTLDGLSFASIGGVERMVSILSGPRLVCSGAQGAACRVLRYYSEFDEAIDGFTDANVHSVIDAIGRNLEYGSMCKHGCRTLGNLSRSCQWSDFIVQNGGFEVIAKAMEEHPQERSVQEAGCSALSILIRHEPSTILRVTRVVLRAMAEHPDAINVQMHGLAFMRSSSENSEAATRIGALAGCDAILTAMARHTGDARLQIEGLRVLKALVMHDPNKIRLARLCPTETLIICIETHLHEREVQELGRQVLQILGSCREARMHDLGLRAISLFVQ